MSLDKRRRLAYLRSLQARVADEIDALEYQLGGPTRHPLPLNYQTITDHERQDFLAVVSSIERLRKARSEASIAHAALRRVSRRNREAS